MTRHAVRSHLASLSRGLIVTAALAAAACGGGSDSGGGSPAPTPTPPSGGGGGTGGGGSTGPTVRTGSRLGWDQRAESAQAVRSYTFRLYVDGNASTISSTSCATTAGANGFECSGVLPQLSPGNHTLQLTAIANGAESTRSTGLVVTAVAGLEGESLLSKGAAPGAADPVDASIVCIDSTGAGCYLPHLVSGDLAPVGAVAPIGGARALFLEGGRAVRLIDGDQLAAQPALVPESEEARLLGLAVPPDFELSRSVFVAWSEPAREGRQLNITRYREVQGTLGQGATVVTGLPIAADGVAPMAFDNEGLLYVALGRAVLRFAQDGSVPRGLQSSPVLAAGYESPSAIAWDRLGRQVWLAGRDAAWPSPVSTLAAQADDASRQTTGVLLQATGDVNGRSPQLALAADPAASGRDVWYVPTAGEVYRGAVQTDGRRLRLGLVDLGGIAGVSAVTPVPDGSLILVSTTGGAGGPTALWRLSPATPAPSSARLAVR